MTELKFKQIEVKDKYIYGLTDQGEVYVARLGSDFLAVDWKPLVYEEHDPGISVL